MVKNLKLIDKFLKLLKTDLNTFLTYILSLITIYLVIDRVAEMLIMIFTGIGNTYWGPIGYALAFCCPIFAFLFGCSSKYGKAEERKLSFFYMYVIALYILIVSMVTQMVNAGCWLLFLSSPAYPKIATQYTNLIAPAFRGISLYFPLTTFYPVIRWLYGTINDTIDIRESIYDYPGINLSSKKSPNSGEFSCEIQLCVDKQTGKNVKIAEDRRYESMLVVGVSGSGKTSLIFEPMIARDIERKHFYFKNAKEYGFAALKSGLASLNCPYDNDYINKNFSLNMLSTNKSKMGTYKSCMKKMIYSSDDNQIIYRDLGLTYISPDFESTSRVLKVAKNYHVKVNLIDPNSPEDSPGLNPFAYDDPMQASVIISSVLKTLHRTNQPNVDLNMGVQDNFSTQAIENLSILLKLTYAKLHENEIPTLVDMLNAFNDFSQIQTMCEELEKDEELAKKYAILLTYFQKNFYPNSPYRSETEKYISAATTQLDNLLRYPGMKAILCKKDKNLNFDSALANGEFILLCTRRGDLGTAAHIAFGLFFLLSMQHAVLRRPGIESTRIPHFLYIDEFSDFICDATEPIFTLYRKYRIGTVISVQNLDQLNAYNKKFRKTIIANCAHKVVFGNNEPDDNDWWSRELGEKTKWKSNRTYDTAKGEYTPNMANIEYKKEPKYKPGKVQSLKFKQCMYKVRDGGGKNNVGIGLLDFLGSKYKEEQSETSFNFTKYTGEVTSGDSGSSKKNKKKKIATFSEYDGIDYEINPIRSGNPDENPDDDMNDGDAIYNINTKHNSNNPTNK